MGRAVKGFWDDRSKRYYARLGEVNEKTGKRRSVMLLNEDESPVAYGRTGDVEAAIRRELARREERERRAVGPTVLEVVTAYLAWHKANGTAEATIRTHRHMLGLFCRFEHGAVAYGSRPATSIGISDLARMRKAMTADGKATGYIKNRYASVLACWRWAARPVEDREPERMIPSNPLDGVIRPSRSPVARKIIPWPLARALLRFAWGIARPRGPLPPREGWPHLWSPGRDGHRWRLNVLALQLAALTGCRPDEAARMAWDEIDWRARTAILRRGKNYRKTGKERHIPLAGRMGRIIRMIRDSPSRHPVYVFLPGDTKKATPPSARELGVWFRGLRDRAIAAGVFARWEGREVTLPPTMTIYWLRHMFQTEGVQVVSVERMAGAVGSSPVIVHTVYNNEQSAEAHSVADEVQKSRRAKGHGRDFSDDPSRGPSG